MLPERLAPPVLWAIGLGAVVFLFLECLTSPLNHDEDHYLGGAVMAKDHAVYRDFTYSAMPLHPVLMGAFLRAFPTERPFLWFRLMSAALTGLSSIVMFLTLRRLARNDTVALVLTSFLTFNTLFLFSTNGLISCHVPALALALGAAWFLHRALTLRGPASAGLCGALLCAAAGFKLYYLLLLPLVLVLLFFFAAPGGPPRRERLRLCAAYCVGAMAAGLPVLIIFFRDPYAFLFNNYLFHQYNTAWRVASGELGRISLLSRIGYVVEKLGFTGNGAVALLLIAIAVGLGRKRLVQCFLRADSLPRVWLVLAVVATIGAMLPRPMHLHYLVFPLPFYILLAASLYAEISGTAKRRIEVLLVCCGVIVLAAGGRYLFQEGVAGLMPARWIPNAVHRDARQIAEALAPYPEPKQVTTLSPLLVIEAGLPFERAFAGSGFFYRVGDVIPPEIQKRLGLVQQGHALELLERTMPAGVLVGFEENLEEEFLAFVQRHGYRAWPEPIYEHGTLYLRPIPG
ncbi:MAG: glycosyltransferase family 39 protein [Candidatus Hydrogenedentes bacterium]|nr:glycosyltransferase family 39 protein [Candidatus Hydrogenedentota bacterium]